MGSDEWDPSVTGNGCSISIYTAKLGNHSPLQECERFISVASKSKYFSALFQRWEEQKPASVNMLTKLKFQPAGPTISKDAARNSGT